MNTPWGQWPPAPGSWGPTPPDSEINARASYIWRPGGVASDTVLTTWAEVQAAIVAADGFLDLYLDTSLAGYGTVDPTADVDCKGRTRWLIYDVVSLPIAIFGDGGVIRNPGLVEIIMYGVPTVRPFIVLDLSSGVSLRLRESGILLAAGATKSAISVEALSSTGQIELLEGSKLINEAYVPDSNEVPTIDLPHPFDANLILVIAEATSPLDATMVGGFGSLTYYGDASAPLPAQILLPNPPLAQLIDLAKGVAYDDALSAPQLQATTVQDAIDRLKATYPVPLWWGGDLTANPAPLAGGTADDAGVANAPNVSTDQTSPIKQKLNRLSWNTATGDATTEIVVVVNGVNIATLALTGAAGVISGPIGIDVDEADLVRIYHSAGTNPGRSRFCLSGVLSIDPV